MREHIFRGKRLTVSPWPGEEPWVKGSLIDAGDQEQVAIFPPLKTASSLGVKDLVRVFAVAIDPDTVGEWTGFVDHHGTQIYEGDFVLFNNGEELTVYEVFWGGSGWRVRLAGNPGVSPDDLDAYFAEHCEVYGNIHDNPERWHENEN